MSAGAKFQKSSSRVDTLSLVKRWVWLGLGFFTLLLFGASYVLLQLTILQPPVVEPNIIEKRASRKFVERAQIRPITELPVTRAGEAAVFHKAASGKQPVVLLPDLGTGAWVFEKFLSVWQDVDAYAVSYRGGLGAASATSANLEDYIADAQAALGSVDASSRKPVLVGQGMGALIALKLAQDNPDTIGGLVLIAPYAPRDWSDQQLWMVRTIGGWAYNAAYNGGDSAKDFWKANFPSGFIQTRLATEALNKYALTRDPFEFRGVIEDVNFTKLEWLNAAYTSLENAKFNVLHVVARYDTINPIGAQRELRKRLEPELGSRYRVVILNSGKYVSMDWKWPKAASAIQAFARDGNIPANIIENEEALDPTTADPPDR
jgi:pimeloyl-ACP methyl ester carboxylesterase